MGAAGGAAGGAGPEPSEDRVPAPVSTDAPGGLLGPPKSAVRAPAPKAVEPVVESAFKATVGGFESAPSGETVRGGHCVDDRAGEVCTADAPHGRFAGEAGVVAAAPRLDAGAGSRLAGVPPPSCLSSARIDSKDVS